MTLNKLLSLDISENNIVALEIKFEKNNFYILNGFHLNTPVLQDVNQTINLIKQSLKSANIKTKECIFGFSMQYFKLFPVPIPISIPSGEIDSIILQESNVDLSENYVSSFPLNNTKRQDADGVTRYDVLGISLYKNIIDFSKVISQKCGLKLRSVSPSFLNIASFLDKLTNNNLIATLWLSQIRSEFVVWSGQEPIYEHLFLTHQLNEQVFQCINYIQTQLPGVKVSSIYTCGPYVDGVNFSQLPFNIQPFPLPANVIDSSGVFQKITQQESVVPIGLVLANTYPFVIPNLLFPIKSKDDSLKSFFKESPLKKKEFKIPFFKDIKSLNPEFKRYVNVSLVIFLLSILAGVFIQNLLMPNVQANQSVSQSRINMAQTQLSKALSYEKSNKVLNLKTVYFSELIEKRKPWSQILREIAEMTPKDLWIDRVDIKNNTIDIFGRALNVDAVANFSINLNYTAKLLTSAQIVALRKFQEEGIDIVEYQVSLRVSQLSDINTKENKHTVPKNELSKRV